MKLHCGYCGEVDIKNVPCSECGREGYLEGFHPWEHLTEERIAKLKNKSGGYWWVISDGGIHGRKITPCWWTGEKFLTIKMSVITYISPMSFPPMIQGNYYKPDGMLVNEDGSRSIFDDLAD